MLYCITIITTTAAAATAAAATAAAATAAAAGRGRLCAGRGVGVYSDLCGPARRGCVAAARLRGRSDDGGC